jgi:hypothetical protein
MNSCIFPIQIKEKQPAGPMNRWPLVDGRWPKETMVDGRRLKERWALIELPQLVKRNYNSKSFIIKY